MFGERIKLAVLLLGASRKAPATESRKEITPPDPQTFLSTARTAASQYNNLAYTSEEGKK